MLDSHYMEKMKFIMKFINLSQHPLTILSASQPTVTFEVNGRPQKALDGQAEVVLNLPSWEGELPSVKPLEGETIIVDDVQIVYSAGEQVVGLPSPQEGVIFITSFKAAKAAGRRDVCCPGELVFEAPHEGRGTIAGCLGLNNP